MKTLLSAVCAVLSVVAGASECGVHRGVTLGFYERSGGGRVLMIGDSITEQGICVQGSVAHNLPTEKPIICRLKN